MILKGEYLCPDADIPDKDTMVVTYPLPETGLAYGPGDKNNLSHV